MTREQEVFLRHILFDNEKIKNNKKAYNCDIGLDSNEKILSLNLKTYKYFRKIFFENILNLLIDLNTCECEQIIKKTFEIFV